MYFQERQASKAVVRHYFKFLILAAILFSMTGVADAATYDKTVSQIDSGTKYVENNSDIITNRGFGIIAANEEAAVIAGDEVSITTGGSSGHGVFSRNHGTVQIGNDAKITTSGHNARGVFAQENSKIGIGKDATITIMEAETHGVFAWRESNIEIGDSATITISKEKSRGVFADENSEIKVGNDAKITTSGANSYGVVAWEWSKMELGESAKISTAGGSAYGAWGLDNASITFGDSARITTSGRTAYGVAALNKSHIKIGDSSQIGTLGSSAYGAYSSDNSNITIGNSSQIGTSGISAYGAYAKDNSSITIGNSVGITTSGSLAYGAYAQNNSGIDIGEGTSISTTGNRSHAVYALDNGSIELKGGMISATGKNSRAVSSESGSQIIGRGQFDIIGDMYAGGTSSTGNTLMNFTLEDGSTFTGKTFYTGDDGTTELNLTLQGSDTRWILTGDSALSSLSMDGAAVDSTQEFSLSLTTANLGQSDTDRGTFIMETSIADEATGRLTVTGKAKGTYILDITNSGGDATTGEEITDLVLLMNEGQSAVFKLDHIVESGGWQFALESIDSPTGTVFYLQSTRDSSTAGSGAINSFAGSYLMAYAETNTLIQRMGDLRDSEYLSGLWFRVHGGKFEFNSKSYVRGFDMKYGGVQIGYDRKLENKWDGDIYLGAMLGSSKGHLDYTREGSSKVDSKTLGIYGVYVRPDGFYVDAVLKYQWMNNDFDVIDTAGTLVLGDDVSTGGLGASIEVGKRFHLAKGMENGNGWYAEPQLQLSYQHQDGGYFNATNGLNIGVNSFTSLLGRVGILVGYETEKTNFYGKVSKVKEFDGDLTIHANGVPVAESFGDNWWVYGVGFTSRIDDKNSLHLDIERTSGGSFRQPWRLNVEWRMEF